MRNLLVESRSAHIFNPSIHSLHPVYNWYWKMDGYFPKGGGGLANGGKLGKTALCIQTTGWSFLCQSLQFSAIATQHSNNKKVGFLILLFSRFYSRFFCFLFLNYPNERVKDLELITNPWFILSFTAAICLKCKFGIPFDGLYWYTYPRDVC